LLVIDLAIIQGNINKIIDFDITLGTNTTWPMVFQNLSIIVPDNNSNIIVHDSTPYLQIYNITNGALISNITVQRVSILSPFAMATNGIDKLYTTQQFEIQIYNVSNSNYASFWLEFTYSFGSSDLALAVNTITGEIFVAERILAIYYVFSENGTFLRSFSIIDLNQPFSIAIYNNILYTADVEIYYITVSDTYGNVSLTFPLNTQNNAEVDCDLNGNIYVAYTNLTGINMVSVYNVNGNLIFSFGNFSSLNTLYVSKNGKQIIYLGTNDGIELFDFSGNLIETINAGIITEIVQINNTLFANNPSNNFIAIFDLQFFSSSTLINSSSKGKTKAVNDAVIPIIIGTVCGTTAAIFLTAIFGWKLCFREKHLKKQTSSNEMRAISFVEPKKEPTFVT